MDISHHDSLTGASTPAATKLGLVVALALVACALAAFVSGMGDAGHMLAAFTLLFALRVAGQVAVVLASPRWLPPMAQWNLVPYRALLPIQIVFLFAMSLIAADVLRGSGTFGEQSPAAGAVLVPLSYAYWSTMAGRYALRMYRRPTERWFGGAIPIPFHCVLAGFLFVYGSYHAAA
jgi:uncharacterized protein